MRTTQKDDVDAGMAKYRRRGRSFTVKPIPYINVVLSFISSYFQIKISHSTYGTVIIILWQGEKDLPSADPNGS